MHDHWSNTATVGRGFMIAECFPGRALGQDLGDPLVQFINPPQEVVLPSVEIRQSLKLLCGVVHGRQLAGYLTESAGRVAEVQFRRKVASIGIIWGGFDAQSTKSHHEPLFRVA
jgi:hypothetical protein